MVIEIKHQIEIDTGNTIETKTFTKKYDDQKVEREELLKDFTYFIDEFIADRDSDQIV